MNIGDVIGGIVGGIGSIVGDVVTTAVGAVMTWVASAVNAVAALADHVVALLPDATDLGLDIPSGWIYGYSILNTFLPLNEALAAVAAFVAVVVAGVIFRLAVTVYHLIPKPFMGT